MASPPIEPASKLFIDSSVLIAAAISPRGSARDLIIAGLSGGLTLVLSALIFEETERNLAKKYPRALPMLEILRTAWEGTLVEPDPALIRQVGKVVALKDAPIVAGALAARATWLVTYDRRHLLRQKDPIRTMFGITVATPDEVLAASR